MQVTIAEVIAWKPDWRIPGNADALTKRRVLWREMPRTGRLVMKRQLNRHRYLRKLEVIDQFAFDQADGLELDSNLDLTPDPVQLLDFAERCDGNGGIDARRWYEALSVFDMVLVQTLVEQRESGDKLRGGLIEFISLLERHVFCGPPESHWVYSYHLPPHHTVGVDGVSFDKPIKDPDPRLVMRRTRLDMRPLVSGGEVYLRPRPKEAFWTTMKLYKQADAAERGEWEETSKGHGPFTVSDRLGLRSVCPNADLVYDLSARLTFLIGQHGGTVGKLENNMTGGTAVDPTNGDSSPNFHAAKFDAKWRGRGLELQFMTVWDYYTNKFATDEAGWYMYKLRQMMNFYFELLFPADLFGFNWKHSHMRHQLMVQMTDKLGWARQSSTPS